MNKEMSTVINRLQVLSPVEQSVVALRFNDYLNKLENIKATIQEGLNSGEPQPLTRKTFQDVVKRGQERHTPHS